MLRKIYDTDPATVSFITSGKLTDFECQTQLMPEVESAIERSGKINLLWKMEGFEGWELMAAWDELVLALKARDAIDRIALVGEQPWQKRMPGLLGSLTHAEVRFFDTNHFEDARRWVKH